MVSYFSVIEDGNKVDGMLYRAIINEAGTDKRLFTSTAYRSYQDAYEVGERLCIRSNRMNLTPIAHPGGGL